MTDSPQPRSSRRASRRTSRSHEPSLSQGSVEAVAALGDGVLHASPSPSEVPPTIAGYVLIRKLASGGMATVWLGQRLGSDRLCVIKQIHAHLAEDRVVRSRFLREAAVASELRHPSIAQVLDAGSDGATFYLAMEFVPGHDLETLMATLYRKRKMLPPGLSLTVAQRVLEALSFAHDYRDSEGRHLGIVHRDLSPRNVMLSYDGMVKLIDFGLARTTLGSFRTAPGMVLGTLRYMSPEQAVAEPVDLRSDLYSFGVVLFEMLTGRPVVLGDTPSDILRAVVVQSPGRITEANPALPTALDPVFAQVLAKDREQRYPSAEAFRLALLAAAETLSSVPAEDLAGFVGALFPSERALVTTWLLEARLGEFTDESTQARDAPEFLPTRAAAPRPDPTPVPTLLVAPWNGGQTPEQAEIHVATALQGPATTSRPVVVATSSVARGTRLEGADRARLLRAWTPAALLGVVLAAIVLWGLSSTIRSKGPRSSHPTPVAAAMAPSPRVHARSEPAPFGEELAGAGTEQTDPAALSSSGASGPTSPGLRPIGNAPDGSSRDPAAPNAGSAIPDKTPRPRRQSPRAPEANTLEARSTLPGSGPAPPQARSRSKTPSELRSALKAKLRAARTEREVEGLIEGLKLGQSTRDCVGRWLYISFNPERVSSCLDLEDAPR